MYISSDPSSPRNQNDREDIQLPEVWAEIPQKEFLSRRDKVVCPVCGKTLIRWQVIQRQDAVKPLGESADKEAWRLAEQE